MENSFGLLFILIALAMIHTVRAQDTQGFISLDCGKDYPSPLEGKGGLVYSSDKEYIQTGKTGRVQGNSTYAEPYLTMRYFPEGIRNCYNLNVDKGRKYLIRAHFVYGNYDGLNKKPVFDLYLGPNPWAKIDLERLENGTAEEIIHIPTSASLQICLVKTGPTTPLISALEIRPLGKKPYITVSGSLRSFERKYYSKSESTLMYSEDVYDRIWASVFKNEWTQISTSLEVNNANDYLLPEDALIHAATPTDASEPLTITWISGNPDEQYYYYAHFAEVEDVLENETRVFNIYWNGVQDYGPVIPKRLQVNTIETTSPKKCRGGECIFQLIRTSESTLPPLLNALEVYTIIQLPQSETYASDVDAIKIIAATYALYRINWQGDPCVPQLFRWDGLNCSNTNISIPPRITTLNLSSHGLTGSIAAAIQNLTQLERLDLSNNALTGGLPEFLGNMKSLTVINLSGNNLNGTIPQSLQKKGLELSVEGNPRLCRSDSCREPPKKKFPVAIVASVLVPIVALVFIVVLFLILRKKKSTIVKGLRPRTSAEDVSFANKNSKRFTYSEVEQMTNNFERVLGKGGFGMVYLGTVNGSQQVAVKVLSQSSTQGYKQFRAEVDLLLRVHHTNLVSLVGYCYEGDHLALIYEFLPNGDLKQHFSGLGGRSIMNWITRLQIALEAAKGLEYLHIGCKPPIVHRDIKTSNILLDENFKAKLADFGLSRSFQGGGESQDLTAVAGTLGYLDPEYYRTTRLGEKSDVYSFGIVLLQMITNQPVVHPTSHDLITKWVGFMAKGRDIIEIMDPNLGKDYDSNSAWRALELAMSCANPSYSERPSMSKVIHELTECIACENSRISKNQGLESQGMNNSLDITVLEAR